MLVEVALTYFNLLRLLSMITELLFSFEKLLNREFSQFIVEQGSLMCVALN